MNKKTIIRKAKGKDNPYKMILRATIQDKRLSWKATGLLTYILSLPDDWRINLKDLANRKQDGISATRTALKELATAGYMETVSYRDEKGRFVGHEHVVYEESSPLSRKPESGILDATEETVLQNRQAGSFSGPHNGKLSISSTLYDDDPWAEYDAEQARCEAFAKTNDAMMQREIDKRSTH